MHGPPRRSEPRRTAFQLGICHALSAFPLLRGRAYRGFLMHHG